MWYFLAQLISNFDFSTICTSLHADFIFKICRPQHTYLEEADVKSETLAKMPRPQLSLILFLLCFWTHASALVNNCILLFAFCFVCGVLKRFVDSRINYMKGYDNSLLFLVMRTGGPWTSREMILRKWAVVADHVMNSGSRNKLWRETAWTFVIPDGARPSFGFGDCCDVCTFCRKCLNSLSQTVLMSWR